MKKLYCICLVVLSSVCLAQAPGYMGKRFVAGYGFYFSPAIFGSNGQGQSLLGKGSGNAETGTLAFNVQHEFFAEYALSKKFMLGFSARIYKSTYDNGGPVSLYNYSYTDQYGYTQTYEPLEQHPEGFYHIKGVNYSLYGKLFFGKYIAPWGRYFVFGPSLKTYSCTYSTDEMRIKLDQNYGQPMYFSSFGPTKQNFTRFDILAGFGRSRIIANRITLDYGFNVQLIALLTTLFDATSETDEGLFGSGNIVPATYIQKTSPERVRGVNRFNAFLKVGVLLF